MGFYVPLFGDGLQWRNALTDDETRPRCASTDEELDAAVPGRAHARDLGSGDAADARLRHRRGCHGAAEALRDQYAELGHSITQEAARERVAIARTRAAARKEAR